MLNQEIGGHMHALQEQLDVPDYIGGEWVAKACLAPLGYELVGKGAVMKAQNARIEQKKHLNRPHWWAGMPRQPPPH